MKVPTLHRPAGSISSGTDPVLITPDGAGWTFCGLHVVHLASSESRRLSFPGMEVAVIPQSGRCEVMTRESGSFRLQGRESVFESLTDLCFLPRDTEFTITSVTGGDFLLASAKCQRRTEAFGRSAEEVTVELRGAGHATRQVNHLLSADVDGPDKLIVVEVLTPGGNWSSYPPHKHDERNEGELPLEEIYYFRIKGEAGFGHHRTYTLDGEIDETVTIHDGDVFLVPRGLHGPCAAAPGYDMYYLNVMAGPEAERAWRTSTDPAHDWLWQVWDQEARDPRLPMTGATSWPSPRLESPEAS